jgi:pimeloyl-ACP methyl ester carboxylesterase
MTSLYDMVSRAAGSAVCLTTVVLPFGFCAQNPPQIATDASQLREYAGAFQWDAGGFLYLQPWAEFTGANQLVAFDENGEARALYPAGRDSFTAGAAVGVAKPTEARIEFDRDASGRIASLVWRKAGSPNRVARRADVERIEDVQFSNGAIRLAGRIFRPNSTAKVPAIILVHGSGPLDREYMLPLARFLVRRGIAVLGYDKRGVGGSSGDWRTASFDDLADDVVAAFEYLKTRPDIDPARVGLLGASQAGWIMPIAATRAKDIAFIVSVAGAAIPAVETTIDQARNEMTARGMKPENVAAIVEIMELQYRYARTGDGWDEYAAARDRLASRLGRPPDTFPANRDDPYWGFIRRLYFHDPRPILRQLRAPTLAIFGELDNNILAEKNRAAWEQELRAASNPDYTLRVLPKANHLMLEANVGSNAEMPTLQRFVPDYSRVVIEWLAARNPGVARD